VRRFGSLSRHCAVKTDNPGPAILPPTHNSYDTASQPHFILAPPDDRCRCYKREVFVQLEDGTYKSEPKEVCLHDELRAVLGPHAQIETYEKRAMVDSVIVRLLLSEVSTNAAKYSPSQEHISSQAKLVTDAAGKDWLQIFVRNANLPGSPHLSPRECEQVFEKGFKKSMPTAAPQSNGVGLSSVKLAAEAAGGDAWMTANEHHTTVYLLLPAAKCAERSESKLLCGRNVKANGLSPLRGRIISGFIDATSHTASKPSPGVGITTHFTVPMGTPRLSNKGLQSSNSNASSLVCIGIDDSPTLRRMQNFLFDVCMRANRQRSGSVGASLAEVYAYVDIVMGRKTLCALARCSTLTRPTTRGGLEKHSACACLPEFERGSSSHAMQISREHP